MTRSVWSDFVNVCGRVYEWYTKLLQYTICYTAFFGIEMVQVYTRIYRDIGISISVWLEMTILDWYISFIRLSNIWIATFFLLWYFLFLYNKQMQMEYFKTNNICPNNQYTCWKSRCWSHENDWILMVIVSPKIWLN